MGVPSFLKNLKPGSCANNSPGYLIEINKAYDYDKVSLIFSHSKILRLMITLKYLKNLLTKQKRATQTPPEPVSLNEPEIPQPPDSFDYYFMEFARKIKQNEPFTSQDFAQAQLVMACMGRKQQEAQRKALENKQSK